MSENRVKLYTPEVLALATGLWRWPLDPAMPFQGRARSASCGSTLSISLNLDPHSRIAEFGMAAQACAIGQASAAIFGEAATGRSRAELTTALARIESWLQGSGELPDWPGLERLSAVAAYPARHGALLLPWKAALDALP